MSAKHPVIAITGSSGAGTTSVMRTFEQIFRREQRQGGVRGGRQLPPLRPHRDEANRWSEASGPRAITPSATSARTPTCSRSSRHCSASTARPDGGRVRKYLHDEQEAAPFGQEPGTFTPWEDLPADTDLLFYEGLHGAVVTEKVDVAAARRPADRRRAGDQPRVDPEAAPRQGRCAATPPRR